MRDGEMGAWAFIAALIAAAIITGVREAGGLGAVIEQLKPERRGFDVLPPKPEAPTSRDDAE